MVTFVKALRSEEAAFLDTNPLANHVLNVIARRARRTPDPLNGLQIGECFVGHKGLGLSEQQYRTVKKNLAKWGFVEFKKAGRASDQGTVAILLNSNVYDINSENEEALDPNGSQCRTGAELAGNLTGDLTGTLTEENVRELLAESEGYDDLKYSPNGRATEGLTEEQRKANGRATEGQRQTKNVKNVKNGRMEEWKKTTLPAAAKPPVDFSVFNASDDQIAEIKRIRKLNNKGVMSQRVVNSLAKEFQKAEQMGYSFDVCLTEWETAGWKSIKADWLHNRLGGSNGSHQQASGQSGPIDHDDTTWATATDSGAGSGNQYPDQQSLQRTNGDFPSMETGVLIDHDPGRS